LVARFLFVCQDNNCLLSHALKVSDGFGAAIAIFGIADVLPTATLASDLPTQDGTVTAVAIIASGAVNGYVSFSQEVCVL
jgi:hypothetical protein